MDSVPYAEHGPSVYFSRFEALLATPRSESVRSSSPHPTAGKEAHVQCRLAIARRGDHQVRHAFTRPRTPRNTKPKISHSATIAIP